MGRNKQSSFRIIVSDSAHARDGRRTEQIGTYDPLREPARVDVNEERALHWLRQGATPSHTVVSLFKRAGVWKRWTDERTGKDSIPPAAAAGGAVAGPAAPSEAETPAGPEASAAPETPAAPEASADADAPAQPEMPADPDATRSES